MSFDLKIKTGDLSIKNGNLEVITESDKLVQDILKLCVTDVGANPLHTWYGTFLSRVMIGSAIQDDSIINIGKTQLDTALNNLKELQNAQNKSLQRMSADEQIASIASIAISRNRVNPTWFDVYVRVISKGLKPVSTNFRVSTI